jgi:hypothetical protein
MTRPFGASTGNFDTYTATPISSTNASSTGGSPSKTSGPKVST